MANAPSNPKLRWWQFSLREYAIIVTSITVMSVAVYRHIFNDDWKPLRWDLINVALFACGVSAILRLYQKRRASTF